MSGVLTIIRPEAILNYHEHIAGETQGNIVGKIEEIIVAVNVAVIFLTQLPT